MAGFRAAMGMYGYDQLREPEPKSPKPHELGIIRKGVRHYQLQHINSLAADIQLKQGEYSNDANTCVKVESSQDGSMFSLWCDREGGDVAEQTVVVVSRGERGEFLGVQVNVTRYEDNYGPYSGGSFVAGFHDPAEFPANSITPSEIVRTLKMIKQVVAA